MAQPNRIARRRDASVPRTAASAGVVAALGLIASISGGCRVWSDVGRSFERGDGGLERSDAGDTAPARTDAVVWDGPCPESEGEVVDLTGARFPIRRRGGICSGRRRLFRLTPPVGGNLAVEASSESGSLLVELFEHDPRDAGVSPSPSTWAISDGDSARLNRTVADGEPVFVRVRRSNSHSTTGNDVGAGSEIRDDAGAGSESRYEIEFRVREPEGNVHWIAPDGDDAGSGTRSSPWQSWPHALKQLEPGDVLVVAPGTWTARQSCESAPTPCRARAALPKFSCDGPYKNGTADAPIRVVASRERRSHLIGDGSDAALWIDACEDWQFEGLTLRNTDDNSAKYGHVVIATNSQHVGFRRVLAYRPNRDTNGWVFVFENTREISVVESEAYRFTTAGVAVSNSTDIRIRRVHVHSHTGRLQPSGEEGSTYAGRWGIYLHSAEDTRVVDTVAENVETGFAVESSGPAEGRRFNGDANVFRGDLARDVDVGFEILSDAGKCDAPDDPECVDTKNRIVNSAVLDADVGFRVAGGEENVVRRSTAANPREVGFELGVGASNEAGELPPARDLGITRNLVVGPAKVGFAVDQDVENWSGRYLNAYGPETPYDLAPRPTTAYSRDPKLGACRIFIPPASPMANIDGGRVGAHLLRERAGDGTAAASKWHPRSGAFRCGAVVEGVNDRAGAECRNLHRRFAVGTQGCPFP